jgi:aspartyl-tRNA synthetase
MVSGFDRYYQITKCFRDEDLRADRQPEFTQIDIEMSFVEEDDVMAINEKLLAAIFKEAVGYDIPLPLPKMTYAEAMNRYGSDKPDIRFGFELKCVNEIVKDVDFKVFTSTLENGGDIRGINVKGFGDRISRKEIGKLEDFVKTYGAKGLAWIKTSADGVSSPIAKFFDDAQMQAILEAMDAGDNDLMLFVADKPSVVFDSLGALRNELAKRLELVSPDVYAFLWVTDFPLFEYDEEEGRYAAKHHPFTAPKDEDVDRILTAPGECCAKAYDIVLNGYEIGGGSIRIHDSSVQEKMFSALGLTEEVAQDKFGFFINAFKYGAPPHGGIAFGLDRIVMLAAGTDNIRDVIAFPKTQDARCPLTDAPSATDEKQLDELYIALKPVEK